MGKTFKILSIDGGGIRGIYPAHILQCIEEKLQINLNENFDMIAGTSTGSIVAAGVASHVPAADIVTMYQDPDAGIFRESQCFLLGKTLSNVAHPVLSSIYDPQHLHSVLDGIFKNKRLGDIKKPLLIPSTDIGNGCVHVLKSVYADKITRDKDVLIKDAILASCSAPTYFDPHKVDNHLLADGGLWANNPALTAVIDAKAHLDINQDDIQILSIGTGQSKTIYGTKTPRKWGFITGWKQKELVNAMLSLQSQSVENYLNLMLRPEQIKRLDFKSDQPLPLDDRSSMEDLISKANDTFTHESEAIKNFILNSNVT